MDNIATPLMQEAFQINGLSVAESGFIGKINLRADFDSSAVNSAFGALMGIDAQLDANTYVDQQGSTLFWLGPDERLLYTDGNPEDIATQWRANSSCAAVEVSDYYTVLKIQGEKARDVFASGSPLDIHPKVFHTGQCAQTRFGSASVLVSMHGDMSYQLQVRWTFARYLFEYIKKVAAYV